jgi:hypothetical protein
MQKFGSDIGRILKDVDLETVTEENGYSEKVVAWADKEKVKVDYGKYPNVPLKDIEDFEAYYRQWQAIERGEATLEDYPKAYMGNFDLRQREMMREYHSLGREEQKEYLEENPDLKLDLRDEWLKENPRDNALLTIFGTVNLKSIKAYDEFDRLVRELGIPSSIVPEQMPRDIFELDIEYDALPSTGTGSATARLKFRQEYPEYDAYGIEHGWFTVPAEEQRTGGGGRTFGGGGRGAYKYY